MTGHTTEPKPTRLRRALRRITGPATSATKAAYCSAAALGLGTAGATLTNGGAWWSALIAGLGTALGTLAAFYARDAGQE